MVVLVCGLPGSGKSYFASRLAKQLPAIYINSDLVRKELFQERQYTLEEKQTVYDEMLQRMKSAIKENKDVVLDATFHKKEVRIPFLEEVQGKTPLYFMEVIANEEIIRQRLERERPDSEADFSIYRLLQQQQDPLLQPHLVLESTNDNIGEMLQKAMIYLKGK